MGRGSESGRRTEVPVPAEDREPAGSRLRMSPVASLGIRMRIHWKHEDPPKIPLAFLSRKLNSYQQMKWDAFDGWLAGEEAANRLLGVPQKRACVL